MNTYKNITPNIMLLSTVIIICIVGVLFYSLKNFSSTEQLLANATEIGPEGLELLPEPPLDAGVYNHTIMLRLPDMQHGWTFKIDEPHTVFVSPTGERFVVSAVLNDELGNAYELKDPIIGKGIGLVYSVDIPALSQDTEQPHGQRIVKILLTSDVVLPVEKIVWIDTSSK